MYTHCLGCPSLSYCGFSLTCEDVTRGGVISFPHPIDAREATATLTKVSLTTSAFVQFMSSSGRLNLIRSPTARSEYVFLVFDRSSFGTSRGETPLAI